MLFDIGGKSHYIQTHPLGGGSGEADDVLRTKRTMRRTSALMRRTAPTLTMSRSRHRWRLQDFRPAAMFLMIEKEDLLKAGVDDSGENEKAEKALTRSPEDCHLRLLSKPNHRSCVIPFTMRLYPLMPVLNMSQEGDERFVYTVPLEVDYKERTKVANPFALQSQRLHPRWRSVCACADFLRTDSVRGVLPLDEREPGSCALTRAAAWTTVLPGPARDHHGPEDPVEEAGHRDDQDQDDPGELRHRHPAEPLEEEMRSASSDTCRV